MKKKLLLILALGSSFAGFSQLWTPFSSNIDTVTGIRYLDVIDSNSVWAIGYDGTFTGRNFIKGSTTSDGVNFTSFTFLPDTNSYSASNISGVNDTLAFIACYSKNATQNGLVLRTIDGGATWTNVATTLMYTGSSNFPNVVHFWDALNGWTMGDPNNTMGWGNEYEIWTTTDGGVSWTRTPAANIPAPTSGEYGLTDVYTTFGNQNIWFGTNKGRVFRSTDAGLTWNVSTVPGGMSGGGVSGLAFSDALNGVVWGLSATTGGTFLMASTSDGGATWTSLTVSATDVGRNDMCGVPGTGGIMSVGIDVGQTAYVTSISYDNGVSWTILESGTTNTERMLEVEMSDATHGWAGNFSDNQLPTGFGGICKYAGQSLVGIKPIAAPSANSFVYPNPSNGLINLKMSKVLKGTTINVIDMMGSIVKSVTVDENSVDASVRLDLSSMAKGVYIIAIANGTDIQKQRIIIE